MQFPELRLQAVTSLIEDEEESLAAVEQEINDGRLNLSKLEVRLSIFGSGALDQAGEVELRELPSRIDEGVQRRDSLVRRLQRLQAQISLE